jgi:hypothetical protein
MLTNENKIPRRKKTNRRRVDKIQKQMGGRDDHLNQEDLDRIKNDLHELILRELRFRYNHNVGNIPDIPDEPNADYNNKYYKVGARGIVTYKVGNQTVIGRREIANRIDPGYIPQFEYNDDNNTYEPIDDGKTVLEELLTRFKQYPDYKLIEQLLDKEGQVYRSKTMLSAMYGLNKREDNKRVQNIYDKIIENLRFVNKNNELREIYRQAMELDNLYVIRKMYDEGYMVSDMNNMTAYLGKDKNASKGDIQKRYEIRAVMNPLTMILYNLEKKGALQKGLGADIIYMLSEQLKNI